MRDLVMAPFGQQTYDGWPDLGLRIWGYEGAGRAWRRQHNRSV